MIYFIQAGENGPIKIGRSAAPYLRLDRMRADNHEELTLIAIINGNERDELYLHRLFNDLRIRGAWFKPSEAMLIIAKTGLVTHNAPNKADVTQIREKLNFVVEKIGITSAREYIGGSITQQYILDFLANRVIPENVESRISERVIKNKKAN